jgi:anti-sigma regulatory factor (Ser/Thr protein kinase)
MKVFNNKEFTRWFIVTTSLAILGLITWNIIVFHDRIKEDERSKMSVWVKALESVNEASLKDTNLGVELDILKLNQDIPTIILDAQNETFSIENVPVETSKDSLKLKKYIDKIASENVPISINMYDGDYYTMYYGNSPILNKIKYYPVILFLIIVLFLALVYFFYYTSKSSEQNLLWAGMAKETAHQIGTPLSSLFGWLEILRSEKNVDPSYLSEIEKDIERLKTITERFSKVGSQIKLEKTDITKATQASFEYLKNRSSKLIQFNIDLPDEPVWVELNEPLFSWTIENLTKNAIDAMKGKGKLDVELVRSGGFIKILISDTGKGIPTKNFNRIFEPGFSTKKRGWGLGLSLAKRIIEDYHHGKIVVAYSEINKGSTFEIKLKRIEE